MNAPSMQGPASDPAPGDDPPEASRDLARGLARFLVGRPVTVLMLFLTLIGTGVLAYRRIPLTLLPGGLTQTSLSVFLPYPGAGPKEVEDQLTRPVEEELRTIPGITEIFAVSSEGGSNLNVSFGNSVDMDLAYAEVRDRIERIRGRLPPEMDRYRIRRWNSNTDMPVMWIGVQYDDQAADPFGPIERIAVPRLEAVDGVAQVGLNGVVDEAVRIFVDMDKAAGYGIDLGEVIRQMRNDNFTLPAGHVDDGQRTFALRIDARFQDEDEIRRYPIGNGRVLEDIADVVRARGYRDSVWRINGRAAVGMAISRESDENTIDVCERVELVIDELSHDPRLADITFNVFFNQKETIMESVSGLQSSALWGGLFAVIVLFAFLRDVRMTLLAALAIPASLLSAVMAVYFGGHTLNLVSMAGFTLGIGMLVDNAVVVIESIARKRAQGLPRQAAAAEGAGEVGIAVLTATLTSIVVFVPLAFMDGDRNTQVLMKQVGLPISWSLAASLLVALVFLPTFTARLMRAKAGRDDSAAIDAGRLGGVYQAVMSWVLGHRFGAFLLLLVLVQFASWCGDNLRASQGGGGDGDGEVSIEVELPGTFTLSDANEVFMNLEGWAESHRGEWGFDFFSSRFDRRGGSLSIWPEKDLSQTERDALPGRLRADLPELAGVTLSLGFDQQTSAKQLRIDINGPDSGVLAALSETIKQRLVGLRRQGDDGPVPLLENVKTDLDKGLDEVHLSVDRERASELGVSSESLRGMVSWGLGGQRLADLIDGERELRVQIEYGQSDEESLEFVRNLGLYTDRGAVVPLAAVALLSFDKALGSLVRRDARTTMGVSALPTDDNLFATNQALAEALAEVPFPDGYGWTMEGGRDDFEADMTELIMTLGFSVLLVYLLIAILLESVMIPVAILISILLALQGVMITLWATDSAMQTMVGVGMVLLAGIVVNNAILLLDRVQHLRAAGMARSEALIRGGRDRLRPILMTALTTIFGLMPMAIPQAFPGQSRNSGYEVMAITVAGGLAFSTLFTLVVVPLFYTYFDDVGELLTRLRPWRDRLAARPSERLTTAAAPGGAVPAAGVLQAPQDEL